MGFLGFLKKKNKKEMAKPSHDVEFPILPPEEDLLKDDDLEIPAPPNFTEEEEPEVTEQQEDFEEPEEDISTPSLSDMPLPEIEEAEERLNLRPSKVSYVKINRYRNILGEIRLIKNRLSEADDALGRITDLKVYKDKEFAKWRDDIEDLQRKLIYVDKTLFGG